MKFRMVDRILDYQPRRSIRGVKVVSFEEYNLKAPFGCEPALPESLVMEGLFQLGNWLIVLSSDFSRMGLLLRVSEIRFLRPLRPGEAMTIDVTVRSYRDDGILFDGVARTGDETIAEGEGCLALPVDLADYCDAADLRVLFAEIHRPIGGGRG